MLMPTTAKPKGLGARAARRALGVATLLFSGAALGPGCLTRPIEPSDSRTTSTIVERLRQTAVDKIDLLLMIDNSGSMADKQQILAAAVPDLVRGLVNPRCLDTAGNAPSPQPAGPFDACPGETKREFTPVYDIHIGIVTSSLGAHGSPGCEPQDSSYDIGCGYGRVNPSQDDRGHLVAYADPCDSRSGPYTLPTYQQLGFLAWDPGRRLDPPGETVIGDTGSTGVVPKLRNMVTGAGQIGCGFESQLESWYRFLVDPEPYDQIVVQDGVSIETGLDTELLQQRADFLRPSSLLAVIMLTDENDCSFKEYMPFPLNTLPGTLPDGNGTGLLRCYDQVNRFGHDFLYPLDRYRDGLTSALIPNRAGELVQNPLFMDLNPADGDSSVRTPDLVFLAGIVGVPWQDIARDPTDLKQGFKRPDELTQVTAAGITTWDAILGDPDQGIDPADPFMVASTAPRSGTNPFTSASVSGSNTINGHDYQTWNSDLQYACIFTLPTARNCTTEGCDCNDAPTQAERNPLCDYTGTRATKQPRAKAYPGLRHLSVLRSLGPQGIVASVCAAQVSNTNAADYGYRPAVGAIIDRLKQVLGGQCLPRTLTPDAAGQVQCLILEARSTGGGCACDGVGRSEVSVTHQAAVQAAQQDPTADPAWDCFCEIQQLGNGDPATVDDDALAACQNDAAASPRLGGVPVDGWCYVDATTLPPTGNPDIVRSCPDTEKRLIRFVGGGNPTTNATLFITCAGE